METINNEPSVDEDIPYDLRKLDRIIKRDVNQFLTSGDPITELEVIDFQRAMNIEVDKIKGRFSQKSIHFTDDEFRRYVQFHQRACIHLTGSLLRYVESPEHLNHPVGVEILSYHIYKTLQHLLDFIEKFYPDYYDPNAWIPYDYRLIHIAEIRTDIDMIATRLIDLGISPSFVQLVLKPLQHFITDEEYDGSYRDINYLSELKSQLIVYDGHDDLELAIVLVQMNFNSKEFIRHWISMFEEIKSSSETSIECIERLYLYHKEICQACVDTSIALDHHQPALKDCLLDWLEKELKFQKKKHKLLRDSEPDEPLAGTETETSIKFDISIAQVAYMISVLVAIKVIQNENIAKLLKLLSRIVRTTKKEAVSYEYFKGRYYKAESGARTAVLNLLQRMIDYIKSDDGKL